MTRSVCLLSALPLLWGCTSAQAYFSADDNLEDMVTAEMKAATDNIHVAIYTFTNTNIEAALEDAEARGVEVEVVADAGQSTTLQSQADLLKALGDSGISVRTEDGFGGGILHDKFAVIDTHEVLTGSYNYTNAATYNNDENLVVLVDSNLAGNYENAFQELWSRAAP